MAGGVAGLMFNEVADLIYLRMRDLVRGTVDTRFTEMRNTCSAAVRKTEAEFNVEHPVSRRVYYAKVWSCA